MQELFTSLLERVGAPLAILGVFSYAVWKLIMWMATNVITPITQSHIGLVSEIKDQSKSNTDYNKTNSETLKKMSELLERENASQDKNSELLKALAEKSDKALCLAEANAKALDELRKKD